MEHKTKRFIDRDQAIEDLRARGISVQATQEVREFIGRIGFFRLSSYVSPFEKSSQPLESPSISAARVADFGDLHRLYQWDSQLRGVVMTGVEPVEVLLRSQLSQRLGVRGPFAHLQKESFHTRFSRPNQDPSDPSDFEKLVTRLEARRNSSKELFMRSRNPGPKAPRPIWVEVEIMDFGTLTWMLKGLKHTDREAIAKTFGCTSPESLDSWLSAINEARNYCAHHSRLWNRRFVRKPSLRHFVSHSSLKPRPGSQERLAGVLAVLVHILKSNGDTGEFELSVYSALTNFPSHPAIQLEEVGFAPLSNV